jgi:hypothetical protein
MLLSDLAHIIQTGILAGLIGSHPILDHLETETN